MTPWFERIAIFDASHVNLKSNIKEAQFNQMVYQLLRTPESPPAQPPGAVLQVTAGGRQENKLE